MNAYNSCHVPALRIGCAGWSFSKANDDYFSTDGSQLERYAREFNAVEINSSFYRPHMPITYRRWAASVPGEFRFSVKLPKIISHEKRLDKCDVDVDVFLGQVENLGPTLGCFLLQLPPSLAFNEIKAASFFDRLRSRTSTPLVCEPRHATWFETGVSRFLREHRVNRAGADPSLSLRAARPAGDPSVQYLRLHGSPRIYYDAYSQEFLRCVAHRLARPSIETGERWCIFDNTACGNSIPNATELKGILKPRGWSRV